MGGGKGGGGKGNKGRGGGGAGVAIAPGRQSTKFLTINGCKDDVVGPIIRGNYSLHTDNHDRPVYRKDEKVGAKGLDVMLYFWEDTDSPDFSGWWFGPQIGGDEVWAFHPDKVSKQPPSSGWQCPFDGPIDHSIQVLAKSGPPPTAGAATPGAVPPGPATKPATKPGTKPATAGVQPGPVKAKTGGGSAGAQATASNKPEKQGKAQKQQKPQASAKDQEKRKQEQELMMQHEEISRQLEVQRAEVVAARKAELAGIKQQELNQIRREHHALLAIKRAMCRLRLAKPETIKDLVAELDRAIAQDSHIVQWTLRQEAEKVKSGARVRVQKISQFLQKAEARKQAAEAGRKAKVEAAKKLIEQLETLVEAAEMVANALSEKEAGLPAPDVFSEQEVKAFMESVAESDKEVQAAHRSCMDYVEHERDAMEKADDCPVAPGRIRVNALVRRTEAVDQKRTEALKAIAAVRAAALERREEARLAAERKAAAQELVERDRGIFNRYDKDKDGKLSQAETKSFALDEFGFEVPGDVLEKLSLKEPFAKGIPFEAFQELKVAIGIAREVARDEKRRTAKKERLATMSHIVEEVEELVKNAEASAESAKGSIGKLDEKSLSADLEIAVAEAILNLRTARTALGSAESKLEEFGNKDSEGVMDEHRAEAERLLALIDKPKQMLEATQSEVSTWEAKVEERRTTEAEEVGSRACALLRAASPKAKGDGNELLEGMGSIDGEPFSLYELSSFLRSRWGDPEPSEDVLVRWLDTITRPSEPDTVTRQDLWMLIRTCFKVVRPTTLSDGISTKDSKTLRQLELGEVLELVGAEAPVRDEVAGLERIKVRSLKDATEGWVTLKSNAGSTFLQRGGDRLSVARETPLTASVAVSGSEAKDPLRELKVGEILDFMGEEVKDEASGHLRVKIRTKSDRLVGWATKVGTQGTMILKQM